MWNLIMLSALIALALCFIYVSAKIAKLVFPEKKLLGAVFGAAVVLAFVLAITLLWDLVNAVIILIHFAVIWLLCDFVFWAAGKIIRKRPSPLFRFAAPAVLAVCYLAVGWYLLHGVWQTDYAVSTDKSIGSLRIVQFADSHVGTSFSGKKLGRYIAEMNRAEPDVLVITGDFVDDDTSKQDMIDACGALSAAKTKYGVYFAFGNHDKGYYDSAYRGYDADDLTAELAKNGVTVLEDEAVLIDNRFYIAGRKDASEIERGGEREDISQLLSGLDGEKYTVVLDHQPTDYENESKTSADLVLSGHTHGGQLIPIMLIDKAFSINDRVYGTENRRGTDFIVTSGISDWAIKFKTGCKSEYNVIDIKEK